MGRTVLVLMCGIIYSGLLCGQAEAQSWGSTTTVTGLLPQAGGYYVQLAGSDNPQGCPTPQTRVVVFDYGAPLGKYLAAVLMQAKAMNSSVSVYYNGCQSSGYAIISGVWLK